ncbi:MAG TPA: conjugative transposon protein TraN [Puia sp.]|jgi:conjugative transposon TraN protein|nr:conjugative transposon protein TraN [Puia sp.]
MKKFIVAFILLTSIHGFSQTIIPSFNLSVCFQKTTNIIFPYRIEKADIGSGDVIGHKDALLENVLFLKANRKGFIPTNLSVYTSDGKLYSFLVQYKENPDTLNLQFFKNENLAPTVSDSINDAKLDSDASVILDQEAFLHRRTNDQDMKLILQGIYIKDHLMWFRMEIKNQSEIDYQPEYIRFYIKDKHSGKRTAIQETDLSSVWQTSNHSIAGQNSESFVFAFPAFTIDKHKKIVIQISEKNGGRQLILEIPAKTILKSQFIN